MQTDNFKKATLKVIGGVFKGRNLQMAPLEITRSSKAILKESLFNTLNYDVVGANFVEFFAGSGSVGIEALSRGAKSAIFFDVNLQLWLCEDCVNKDYKTFNLEEFIEKDDENSYSEDFNNILVAMEKLCNSISESNNKKIERQFKNTPYSKDLNELLSAMTRERLAKIAETLGIRKVYKYKKQDLKEVLLSSYETLILEKFKLLDEKAFKSLRKYSKNDGERILDNISNDEGIYVDYFAELGAIFPVENKDGNKVFLMPTVTQELVKILEDFQVRRKIKNNTKIINLYRGMVRAYGLLEVYQIVEFLKQYLVEEYDYQELVNILKESSKYSDEYIQNHMH